MSTRFMNTYFEYLPQEMLIEVSMYLDRQSLINFIKLHKDSPHNFMYFRLAGIYNNKNRDKIRIRNCILNEYKTKHPGYSNFWDISSFNINTCTGMVYRYSSNVKMSDYIFLKGGVAIAIHKSIDNEFFKNILDTEEIKEEDVMYISNW